MTEPDLIQNNSRTPTFHEIGEYISGPGRDLWNHFNSYVQQSFTVSPKIMFSTCSAKPGWNVKYQKSGSSLCTLYPEKSGFTALVVITLDLAAIIRGMSDDFTPEILLLAQNTKPFNGTLWLMIPVYQHAMLESVKLLLMLKQEEKTRSRAAGKRKASAGSGGVRMTGKSSLQLRERTL